jgi:hypothetical protein
MSQNGALDPKAAHDMRLAMRLSLAFGFLMLGRENGCVS